MAPLWKKIAFSAVAYGLVSVAWADGIKVNKLQLPAWVINSKGLQKPLVAGQALGAGDTILTGAGGRVELLVEEGSTIKLGESARFKVANIVPAKKNEGVFSSALEVIKGAFRFTTASSAKATPRRVDIKVATLTAGIRGTDLWGKANDERDLVCLLEGKIEVNYASDKVTLDQERQFYAVNRNGTTEPISIVPEEKVLKEWAPQTDLVADQAVQVADGKWSLLLSGYKYQYKAKQLQDLLVEDGVAVLVEPGKYKGKKVYFAKITQLGSEQDAEKMAQWVKTKVPDLNPAVTQ